MSYKNKETYSPRLLSTAAFLMALSGPATFADTAAESSDSAEKDVVDLPGYVAKGTELYTDQINALKTPTPIINVPQSLSITDSETISQRGFDSIGDIVTYTPGVNMSMGEGHRDAVVFRGVRSTADFFVDGVRDDVQYYRPLYNVEQVEILRGPNALFFGRGGAGGVLNRVMKKGEIGDDFNAFTFGVDSFGAFDGQWDSNIGIDEKSAFRINAFYEHLDNHREFFDGERFGVTPTFRFQFTEDTTLDVSYEYMDHERFIDRGVPTGADGEPVDDFEDIVFGDPDHNESTLEAHVFRALLQHRFSDVLKGNLTASYGTYDKYYANFYAADYDEIATPDVVTLDGYVDQTERDNFILSGNLIGEFETGDIEHTLIFGGEFIDTSSDQDRFNPDFDPGPGTEDTADFSISGRDAPGTGFNAGGLDAGPFTDRNDATQSDLSVYSFFLQDEIQLLEELQVVLGLRYDSFDIDVVDVENGTSGSQRDEEVTPRLGLVYKPQENISVYASYSETFLPQSGEQFANLGDEGLDPDEFSNLEAGVKWDFAEGLSFTAAVFEIQQDAARSDGESGGSVEEIDVQGFEAQISGYITDDWFISAGYSYMEGEDTNGFDPREIPEHTFSIWNRYQLTEKLGLGLGATYQDESYISNVDPDDLPLSGPRAELPSYVRVDAAAYYQLTENLRLQLNIENLLDELYFPSAHSTHQATVGAPINARLSISGRF
ncbi:TonB-dependent siderophore receptor [Coraliomargarita sinensis]|uniref:TonB-dependent siderophore receptor n=1 Tax=Coraliomargarita sinensis TaxID=2174842 RepID=A0A317ZEK4_9BACT|nr:TonB-dependent siderophore receptor [Coraliomargarita sinensis]PXA03786.1 TonB-dependent siderophore receptor [Coraliomargarita sinensis]